MSCGNRAGTYIEEARSFKELGYAMVPQFLSREEVSVLSEECFRVVEVEAEKSRADPADEGWAAGQRGCIFQSLAPDSAEAFRLPETYRTEPEEFARARSAWPGSAQVCHLLLGQQMLQLATAMLGTSECWLYNDQYIVKPARSQLSSFQWHRDSDWCCGKDFEYHPYISVWCALENMTSDNGTLVVQPLSCSKHTTCNMLEPHEMNVRAGDAVVMSDRVLHASGPNISGFSRAAWMPQYSSGPIRHKQTGEPVSLAVPLAGRAS
mmetsp:Transcript_36017/g.101988  ORF Transcript_36017/g.101988 Transcript_36017/m.101988 type:complete len:265 (-) Transcript_36017:307-1101(-)